MNYWWFVHEPWVFLGVAALFIGIVSTFGSSFIKKQLDEISKQDKATKRLDAHSLSVLEQMDGLHFVEPTNNIPSQNLTIIEALRQLTSLELIALDVFPSDPSLTRRYYLTILGRYILEGQLHRHLFRKNFCEMVRVRYWRRSDKDFEKREFERRKNEFKREFGISWENAWVIFDSVIRLKERQAEDIPTMSRWESYDRRILETIRKEVVDKKISENQFKEESFKKISSEIVEPWSEKIKYPNPWLPNKEQREKILRLDGLFYRGEAGPVPDNTL